LNDDRGVILDAMFRCAADRLRAEEMAITAGARRRLIECRLPPDQIPSRLECRAARKDVTNEATWDTYLRQRKEFKPLATSSHAGRLVLDTPSITLLSKY
jgi:predicted kinase